MPQLEWVSGDAAAELGVDTSRIGVLGESAGGGLAASLALLARDRNGPRLTAQFLDAPTVDDRLQTHSIRTLVDVPVWQPRNSPYGWGYYLRGTARPGQADVPLYAAPAARPSRTSPICHRRSSRRIRWTRLVTKG